MEHPKTLRWVLRIYSCPTAERVLVSGRIALQLSVNRDVHFCTDQALRMWPTAEYKASRIATREQSLSMYACVVT